MNRDVLVTGGAGFIGSYLVKRLLSEGDRVTVIDNLSTGDLNNLKGVIDSDKFVFIENDVSEISSELKDLDKFDEVYHLAAAVGVKKILEDPLGCMESNIKGTEALLNFFKQKRSRIFIASTSEVYGKNDAWSLNEESDRITGSTRNFRWIYAATKAMDEFMSFIYQDKYNLDIVVGRFFSIVGERQKSRYGMVLPTFVEQAIKNEPITVYGSGDQIRSFMDVGDCVDCVISLMRSEDLIFNGAINIGNLDPIMIKDLAWRVKHWAESKSEIVYIPYEEAYGNGFEDMKRRVPDLTSLSNVIGNKRIRNFLDLDSIIKVMVDKKKEELG